MSNTYYIDEEVYEYDKSYSTFYLRKHYDENRDYKVELGTTKDLGAQGNEIVRECAEITLKLIETILSERTEK